MAVESGTGLSGGGGADRASARAEGGGALRSAARRALRPVWRSLSFHARFRLRRLSNPARWRCLFSRSRHAAELRSILDLHRGRPAVVCVPTQEWNDLFQRPQQLARALADRGALVFYLTPGVRRDRRAGFEEVETRLYVANVCTRAMEALRGAVAIVEMGIANRKNPATTRTRAAVEIKCGTRLGFRGKCR